MSTSRRTRQRQRCSERDAIAREAARRLTRRQASNIDDARDRAAASLDLGSARRPGARLVRQHAQMIGMQSMGEAAYRRQIRAWLEMAEDLMSTIEAALPDSQTLLVGRAADGHFDGDPALHIRIRLRDDIGAIARTLTEYGYDVPDATFPALHSAHGRLSQMQWVDESGMRVTLTRCPAKSVFENRNDLVTGKPQSTLTLNCLQQALAAK